MIFCPNIDQKVVWSRFWMTPSLEGKSERRFLWEFFWFFVPLNTYQQPLPRMASDQCFHPGTIPCTRSSVDCRMSRIAARGSRRWRSVPARRRWGWSRERGCPVAEFRAVGFGKAKKVNKIPILLRHFTFSRKNDKEHEKTITMTYFDAKTADAEVSDRHDSRNDQEDGGHAEQ